MAPPPTTSSDKPVLCLPPDWDRSNGASLLAETLEYAQNPELYLRKRLGETTFAERQHLLCLPPILNSKNSPAPSQSTSNNPLYENDHGDVAPIFVDQDVGGYGSSFKDHFEAHIAKLFGMQQARFFITGIMAQNACLKVWTERVQRRNATSDEPTANNTTADNKATPVTKAKVAWHGSSHLEFAEKSAFQELWGMERIFLGSRDGDGPLRIPTLSDVQQLVSLPVSSRPSVILLELPARELGFIVPSWSELEAISSLCRANNIILHLDGARIWDVAPFYAETAGKSLADIAQLFDSVYVSFYKGLRGTTGCMLMVGHEVNQNHNDNHDKNTLAEEINSDPLAFLREVDIWRTRTGGGLFNSLYNLVENQRCFNLGIGTFAFKTSLARDIVAQVSTHLKQINTASNPARTNPIMSFLPERPQCPYFHVHLQGFTRAQLQAALDGIAQTKRLRVLTGLRSWTTQAKILKGEMTMGSWAGPGSKSMGGETHAEERHFYAEFNIDASNVHIPVETFVEGYVSLIDALNEL